MGLVRIGIVGIGNMGSNHAAYLYRNEVPGAKLTAICDTDVSQEAVVKVKYGEDISFYNTLDAMLDSGGIDALIVATPHYSHPAIAITALRRNFHVLVEKPAGVYTKQVREMNEVAATSGKVFGIMFNQRTNPLYQKLKELISNGELGELKRTVWLITNWYRPQSYYDSGGWRATWAGEGGGVLANQDPHQLDLWQWTIGMLPKRVRAFCSFGKYHDIEVEDDVTAYVEFENGASGLFVTSTGEAPGTNRLEVSGDRGKIVIEDGKMTFWRLRVSEREFNRTYKGGFGQPECWKYDIPVRGEQTAHKGITANWVSAINNGTRLLAPGEDGIKGVQLANAMHLSSWIDDWVSLPVDEELYLAKLNERIEQSPQNGR